MSLIRTGIMVALVFMGTLAQASKYFKRDTDTVVGEAITYQKVREAVFNATYIHKISDTGSCTNTYISNEGHFITAAHCVKSCVNINDALIGITFEIRDPQKPGFPIVDGYGLIDQQALKVKTCPMIDGKTGESFNAELIASGPSFPLGGNPFFVINRQLDTDDPTPIAMAIHDGIVNNNMDFAILKDPRKPKTSCAKVANKRPKENLDHLPVWSLSYPAKTKWAGETLADGKTPLVSHGKILADYTESPETVEFANSKDWYSANNAEGKSIIFNLKYTRIVDTPINNGSSGGSMFDLENKIVGINSFVMDNGDKPGVGYIIDINEIKNYVSDNFADVK
ncbi:MAG: trypsin-like peptidase domain-containing protein, partial [Pseudomonadota bacterium]